MLVCVVVPVTGRSVRERANEFAIFIFLHFNKIVIQQIL